MIIPLPTNEECRRILATLNQDPRLVYWEQVFIDFFLSRSEFTDNQKSVISELKLKYQP